MASQYWLEVKLGFKVFLIQAFKKLNPYFNIKISSLHIFGAMVTLQVFVFVGYGETRTEIQVFRKKFHIHITLRLW